LCFFDEDLEDFNDNTQLIDYSWKNGGKERKIISFDVEDLNPNVKKIRVEFKVPNAKKNLITSYIIYGNGDILIKNEFIPNKNMIRYKIFFSIGYFKFNSNFFYIRI
jgi:hypothetical protein